MAAVRAPARAEAAARGARRPPPRRLDAATSTARALALGVEIHLPRYQPRSTLPLAACLWAQRAGPAAGVQARALRGVLLRGRGHRDRPRDRAARPRGPGSTRTRAIAAAYSPERFARIARDPCGGRGGGRRAASPRCSPRTGRATGAWAASSACSPGEPLVPDGPSRGRARRSGAPRARARASASAPCHGGRRPRRGSGRASRGRARPRPGDPVRPRARAGR